MKSYIRSLHTKSEEHRKRVLFVSLAVTMSLVVFVWVYNLSDHIGNQTPDETATAIKPFSLFASSISGAYNNIAASVGKAPSIATPPPQKQIDLIPVEPKEQ